MTISPGPALPGPRAPRVGHRSGPLFRVIFFDAGGTLIHPDRRFVLDRLAAEGLSRDESLWPAADAAARDRVADVLNGDRRGDDRSRSLVYWSALLEALGCTGEAAERVRGAVAYRLAEGRLWTHVEPGTRETLAALRGRGYALGVVSNSDGRVDAYLDAAGLRDQLDFVVDSERVGVEKPDPRIFEIACMWAGVDAGEAVHVGDIYEIDIVGARAAGVQAVLIDPLDRYGVMECPRLRSIVQLPDWVEARTEVAGGDVG